MNFTGPNLLHTLDSNDRIIVETQFCFNFCNSLIAVIAIGPRVELPVGVCMEEI